MPVLLHFVFSCKVLRYIKYHFQRSLDILPASVGNTSDTCWRTVQRPLDGPHILLRVLYHTATSGIINYSLSVHNALLLIRYILLYRLSLLQKIIRLTQQKLINYSYPMLELQMNL